MPDPNDPLDPPTQPPRNYPPYIATSALPNGSIGSDYSQTLFAYDGTAPYTFALVAGALPAGIALTPATGLLSGSPTASGTFIFQVSVTDSDNLSSSVQLSLVVPAVPTIQNTSLQAGIAGIPYAAVLVASGGAAPYGFELTAGALPAGLALATTGGITGIPTTAETATFTVQVYDSSDPQGMGSATFSIVISMANAAVTQKAMDACVLHGGRDGALYILVPGQHHDEDASGDPVAFFQQWKGVPTSGGKMTQNQLGGATVGAKGSGQLNVSAINDAGWIIPLSSDKRPMILETDEDTGATIETTRDFAAKGIGSSPRFGIVLDNGGALDAWFEAHVAELWIRPLFSARKA